MDKLTERMYEEFCEKSKREPFSFCREHEMTGFGFDRDTGKKIEAAAAALESMNMRSGSWVALSSALSRAAAEALSPGSASPDPHPSSASAEALSTPADAFSQPDAPIPALSQSGDPTSALSQPQRPIDALSQLTALEETPAKTAVAIAIALRTYIFPHASIHLGFNCDKYDRLNIFYEWDISDEYPEGHFTQYI